MKLKVLKPFRGYRVGEEFEATAPAARALILMGKAAAVEEVKAVEPEPVMEPAVEAPARPRRVYRRRSITTGETETK